MIGSRRLTMALAAAAVPVVLTAGCASTTTTSTASTSTASTSAASTSAASTSAASTSAASAHPAAAARAAPTARFSARGLSFRYPAGWRTVTPQAGLSDFPALIVYLSTSRLTGTCVASASAGRIAETCAYPVRVLPRGGVLVRWNANALPTWRMPKANTTVAGRRAVETKTRGGWCAVLGAAETITVMIPRATPGNWYQMDACLRAPGLSRQEAQISSMLRSVRISPGS